jgi:hypothetical protein
MTSDYVIVGATLVGLLLVFAWVLRIALRHKRELRASSSYPPKGDDE